MEDLSRITIKVTKIIVKYIPFIIGFMYLLHSILFCFGISFPWLMLIYRFSILSFICLLAMSKLLKFCIWHRLPLYYAASIDIINTIDYYLIFPISNELMIYFYLVITGIFILIGMYLKEKHNEKNRITKTDSSKCNK